MKQKGFTLIELLAVIVILAIIMVIAVPQILNVIDSSRTSAWENSAKLVKDAIVTNTTLYNPSTGAAVYTITGLCSTPSDLTKIADLGDMKDVTCTPDANNDIYIFYLEGKNQFDGKKKMIVCNSIGKCSVEDVPNYSYITLSGNSNTVPSNKAYIRKELSTEKMEVCGAYSNNTVCFGMDDYDRYSDNSINYSGQKTIALIQKLIAAGSTCPGQYSGSFTCNNGSLYCTGSRGESYCSSPTETCVVYSNGTFLCNPR